MKSNTSAPNYYNLSKTKRNSYYTMEDDQYLSVLDDKIKKISYGQSSSNQNLKSLFNQDFKSSGIYINKNIKIRFGLYI